ncbi:hypothetical protein F5B22DRAFT_594916 [Xylaria bambusicola]|uniref:uncharacterized protein n=1 Tax=Xylaria bambusicola TaxID=326684 RepID=UPI002008D92F|nr:uncharacterized protein F5B22DRAFT_594916 [Xylaria bambusicola]KAI0521982.1 hypothetical protein F5B22DRAFT_594916 [Xylaria bambusicola]
MALLLQNREATNTTVSSNGRRGWVSSPDTRGTMDIIWPCLTALALVLWTMLHLNLPAPSDSNRTVVCRRIRWLLVGLLAPELILMFSFAQFTSAQQSVEDMKNIDRNNWTLVHGFYADSGGFQLHVPNYKPFPITAKQVVYLTQHGYIDMPTITKLEINDKSKANRETKVLAFVQTGWLVTKLIARAGQGLQITPYELTTVALLVCSFTTLILWWNKPLDVRAPTPVHLKGDLKIILEQAGDATGQGFTDTPLDFIEGNIYWSRKAHESYLQFVLKWGFQTFPIERISNDRDYQPRNFKQNLYLVLPVSAFGTIHLSGYNLSLPTETEQMLWRINSIIMVVTLFIHCVSELIGCWCSDFQLQSLELWGEYKKKMPSCLIFYGLATIYFISRIILLVESVISLRDLPEAAYREVSWTQYLPRL